MIASGDDAGLAAILEEFHPASVADFTDGLTVEETWELLSRAGIERQAEILPFFRPEKQIELARGAPPERLSRLLEAMSHDDRVDLLQRLDEPAREGILPLVSKREREDIRRLSSYPRNTAGSVMTSDYATLPPDVSVEEALRILREHAPDSETIYYVYVVDSERRLIGFVSLRDLVLAKPSAKVREIMKPEVISVRADEDQENVARQLAKYDFLAIPVVDEQGRLAGIVTHDDVADVLSAEATEDIHLGAAVAPLERGYAQSGVWFLYRRRVGWLVALVFVNLASSGVVAAYEETLQAAIALAFFLPLLIDSGGNTGSQAATLMVRALAVDEVGLRHWGAVAAKETMVGFLLATTMAAASFSLGALRGGFEVGLIVGLSMFCIVVFTNLIGVLLPFVLARLRFDPAVASSPLITSIADVAGLLVYFSVATWIMQRLGTLS
jgi:magnesium transporter